MQYHVPFMTAATMYLTQVTALCNFYVLFFSNDEDGFGQIEMVPWLIFSLVTLILVSKFLKKQRSLLQLIAFGVVIFFITAGVMAVFFIQATGFIQWSIALLCLAFTTVQGCTWFQNDFDFQFLILHCELPTLWLVFLLWIDSVTAFYFPKSFLFCTMSILALNFLSLISLRARDSVRHVDKASKSSISTAVIIFVGVGGIAASFVYFAIAGASNIVEKLSAAIYWFGTTLLALIIGFLNWISQLFDSDMAPVEPPVMEEVTMIQEVQTIQEVEFVSAQTLIIFLIVVILIGLGVFLFKMRHLKFGGRGDTIPYHRPKQIVVKIPIYRRILLFLQRIFTAIRMQILINRRRNTPQGAVIILSKIGRRKGVKRGVGESYRTYLNRLALLCRPLDSNGADQIEKLAKVIDCMLYAPYNSDEILTPKNYKQMRSAANALSRK